jgi:hypothetical protein
MRLWSSTATAPPVVTLLNGTDFQVSGNARLLTDLTVTGKATVNGGYTLQGGGAINGAITNNTGITIGGANNTITINTPPSTTSAANVRMAATGGPLQVSTSLSKYKLEQEPMSLEAVRGVLALTPKTWFDRNEVTDNGGSTEGLRRVPGLIAEDVEELAPALAVYDDGGELQGVAYDRVAALLIPIIGDQQSRIEALEARLDALEGA